MGLYKVLKQVRFGQARRFDNIYLPSKRFNEKLSDDHIYVNSAVEQVDSILNYCTLNKDTRILDFGCGQGRFANGLIMRFSDFGNYCGIDTDVKAIKWCNRWINRFHPNFTFHHVDAHNARYNPSSKSRQSLPLKAGSYDIAFLNSVFSHMLSDDVEFYLEQMHKALGKKRIMYVTAFIEENVPQFEENPEGYLDRRSLGPLHRVRYEKSFFISLFEKARFNILDFQHQKIERTKQSVLVAKKTDDPWIKHVQ